MDANEATGPREVIARDVQAGPAQAGRRRSVEQHAVQHRAAGGRRHGPMCSETASSSPGPFAACISVIGAAAAHELAQIQVLSAVRVVESFATSGETAHQRVERGVRRLAAMSTPAPRQASVDARAPEQAALVPGGRAPRSGCCPAAAAIRQAGAVDARSAKRNSAARNIAKWVVSALPARSGTAENRRRTAAAAHTSGPIHVNPTFAYTKGLSRVGAMLAAPAVSSRSSSVDAGAAGLHPGARVDRGHRRAAARPRTST
jgi:hypothetical protein